MRAGEKGLIRFVVFSIATILAACGATRPEGFGRPSTTPTIGHPSPGITEPSPLASLTPTSVLTVVPSPTQRFSVIDPDGYSEYLNGLMNTNGGCELPCWWGITPGVTRWEDAQLTLGEFVDRINIGKTFEVEREGKTYELLDTGVLFSLPGLKPNTPYVVEAGQLSFEVREDGVIELIVADPNFYGEEFDFLRLLKTQGQPHEILVYSLTNAFENGDGFVYVVLNYPQAGLLVTFDNRAAEQDESLYTCFDEFAYTVYLWPEEMKLSVDQILHRISWVTELQSIVDVMGINERQFYQNQLEADLSCINIPIQ